VKIGAGSFSVRRRQNPQKTSRVTLYAPARAVGDAGAGSKNPLSHRNEILHRGRCSRHHHPHQILRTSVQGFWGQRRSNFPVFHWFPLTFTVVLKSLWHYRANVWCEVWWPHWVCHCYHSGPYVLCYVYERCGRCLDLTEFRTGYIYADPKHLSCVEQWKILNCLSQVNSRQMKIKTKSDAQLKGGWFSLSFIFSDHLCLFFFFENVAFLLCLFTVLGVLLIVLHKFIIFIIFVILLYLLNTRVVP